MNTNNQNNIFKNIWDKGMSISKYIVDGACDKIEKIFHNKKDKEIEK
jgi:hypothetical protein